jgi:hypothetical protein
MAALRQMSDSTFPDTPHHRLPELTRRRPFLLVPTRAALGFPPHLDSIPAPTISDTNG